MSVLSKSFQINFTQVPNQIINDERVSLKAKGLYLYFVSKPDNWQFSLNGMTSQLKESKDTIISIINELCKFGYMDKIKKRNGSRQGLNDYILHLEPYKMPYSSPESKNQSLKIRVGKSESEKSTTSNTKKSNKENNNTLSSNERENFRKFKEHFLEHIKDELFYTKGIGWLSDTAFKIENGLIKNVVANKIIPKDESLKIWNYLFDESKKGLI